MNWQKLSLIIGCVVGLIAIGGSCFQLDKYFAHAEEVRGLAMKIEFTNQRLEQKIITDDIRNSQKELWELEMIQQTRGSSLSLIEQRRMKELKSEIEELKEEKEQLRRKE